MVQFVSYHPKNTQNWAFPLILSKMETLCLQFSPISAMNIAQKPRRRNYLSGSALIPTATGPSFLSLNTRHNCRGGTRMQVVEEEYEVKQMRDMAAARKRWEALVREGKVKVLTPREAGYAIQLSNKTLLDVRPSIERKKAWVKGSTWIPIFDVEDSLDAGTLSRKITGFVMGGLEAAEEEDLEREGPQPFKLAGIGGLSEFLGWTDQQRAAAAKEGWGYRLVFSARLVGLFLVADALFLGAQQVGRYLQDLRSH